MELRDALKNIYKNLEKFNFSKEQEKALYDYGKMFSGNDKLLEKAERYYKMIFPGGNAAEALPPESDGNENGMLFAVIFLVRCELFGDALEKDGIPAEYAKHGIWHYKNLFEKNKNCYGSYGFCGMYRSGMIKYIKPKTFTLERLSFEMDVFSGPYEVYRSRESGKLVPIADNAQRYLKDGRPAPKDAAEFFETTFSDKEIIEGYTFNDDGTLNFNAVKLDKTEYEKVIAKGDNVISVHIPEMGRLTPESVRKSFEQAKQFFGKYYSEKHFKAFICSSWLLDTNLKNFLDLKSNIIRFQENFRIVLSFVNTFSIYWHIFGVEKFVPYSELVPKNDFQKKIRDYAINGGNLYSGSGFILI